MRSISFLGALDADSTFELVQSEMAHMGEIYFDIDTELVRHNGSEADQHLTSLSFNDLQAPETG